MATVETPDTAIVAARIELSAGIIDACCQQIDKGDIPAAELTQRIRQESQALRTAVGRDATEARRAAITETAFIKCGGEK